MAALGVYVVLESLGFADSGLAAAAACFVLGLAWGILLTFALMTGPWGKGMMRVKWKILSRWEPKAQRGGTDTVKRVRIVLLLIVFAGDRRAVRADRAKSPKLCALFWIETHPPPFQCVPLSLRDIPLRGNRLQSCFVHRSGRAKSATAKKFQTQKQPSPQNLNRPRISRHE